MRSLLLVLSLSACVPQDRYDQTLLAYSEAVQHRTTSAETYDTRIAALQAERDAMDVSLRLQTDERARLQQALDAQQAELDDARQRLVAAVDDAGALSADIDEMRAALEELDRQRAQAEASVRAYQDLVSRFQSLIDAGTLNVRVVDGRMLLQLATDILFSPGSASVSPAGRTAITEVAAILADIPDRRYQVAGHTDNVPISTQRMPSNWYLGAARAIEVVDMLVASGLPAENVSAASYSQYQPVAVNDTTEGRRENRRIEIVIVPDLSQVPGFSELEDASSP